MQFFIVISAIVLGLAYAKIFGGFLFSSAVCLAAGVFLVTPSLFKFKLNDLKIIKENQKILALNLGFNFVLLPIVALIIGYMSQDFGIAGALLLLALLPGGGMIMHWIKQSGANIKLGFMLFMINLLLLLPAMLAFNYFKTEASGFFPTPELIQSVSSGITNTSGKVSIPPMAPFMILIVIPFVFSRLILKLSPALVKLVEKHQKMVSKLTIFGIIFYLFALKSSQVLFNVPLSSLLTSFVATLAFYIAAFALAQFATNKNDPNQHSLFWHVISRYVTLALIMAVFSIDDFGITFILPVMFAYFIQIGLASLISSNKATGMESSIKPEKVPAGTK